MNLLHRSSNEKLSRVLRMQNLTYVFDVYFASYEVAPLFCAVRQVSSHIW